jgi:hypothetical protein
MPNERQATPLSLGHNLTKFPFNICSHSFAPALDVVALLPHRHMLGADSSWLRSVDAGQGMRKLARRPSWTERGPRRPLGRRERAPFFDLPLMLDHGRNGTIVPLDETYAV